MADVIEIVQQSGRNAQKNRDYSYLRPYQFKKGQPPPPGAGRPKGRKDARTIYLDSLPLKARQWVKDSSPATLIDARKIALPIESDQSPTVNLDLLAWMERDVLNLSSADSSLLTESPSLPVGGPVEESSRPISVADSSSK